MAAVPESDSDGDLSEPAESEDEEYTVKNVSKTKKKAKEKSGQVKAAPAPKKMKPSSKPAKSKSPGGGTFFYFSSFDFIAFFLKIKTVSWQQQKHQWEVLQLQKLHPNDLSHPPRCLHRDLHSLRLQQGAEFPSGHHQVLHEWLTAAAQTRRENEWSKR